MNYQEHHDIIIHNKAIINLQEAIINLQDAMDSHFFLLQEQK